MATGDRNHEAEAASRAFRRTVTLIDREYQLREVGWIIGIFIVLIVSQLGFFALIAFLNHQRWVDDLAAAILFTAVALAVPTLLGVFASWVTFRRTHRVAGAAYRLTQDMEKALHKPGFRFKLRKNDYLQELADELNRALDRYETREQSFDRAEACLRDARAWAKSVQGRLPPEQEQRHQELLQDLQTALAAARNRPQADEPGSGAGGATLSGGPAVQPAAG